MKEIKQWLVDNYNRIESWIVGFVFLVLGICATNIYQSASILANEKNETDFFAPFRHIDHFQSLLTFVMFLIFLGIGYWLKNSTTTKEQELMNASENKQKELADAKTENSQLQQSLEEAQNAISDIRSQNIDDLFYISSQFLRFLFNELGLNHQDRLSIYIHNPDKCYFSLIARYSSNTDFCKQHRQTFPDNEGVLGTAWRGNGTGLLKVYTLPTTFKSYVNKCIKTFNIPEDSVKRFTMRSTRLLPIFIFNNQKQIGIFLVESVRKAADGHVIKDSKDSGNEKFSKIVEKHESYFIDLIDMYLKSQQRIEIIQESDDE